MARPLNKIAALRITLGLIVAIGILGSRSEKLFIEVLAGGPLQVTASTPWHEPFDPRRVPSSGGMASRLLAGISVKL